MAVQKPDPLRRRLREADGSGIHDGVHVQMTSSIRVEYFLAVAACRNFTAAARMLHITQPALSKQIKVLEAELGCELFIRDGGGVRLTEAGEFLCGRAKPLISGLNNLPAEMDAFLRRDSGLLRIGCGAQSGRMLIPGVVVELLRRHPGIRPRIVERGVDASVAALLNGELDVVFASRHELDARLRFTEMFRSPMILIFSEKSSLARLRRITSSSLRGERLVTYVEGSPLRKLLDRVPELNESPVLLSAYNTESLINYVRLNLGFAIVPEYLFELSVGTGIQRGGIDFGLELEIGFIEEAARATSPLVRLLMETARDYFESRYASGGKS